MKKSHLVMVLVVAMSLFWLSGCGEDGDGKIEMKEPRKELSDMPERKNWLEIDIFEESE